MLSDFLLELNHYEWVLGILLDFLQNHAVEDDILTQYLVPTICKALAILKMVRLMNIFYLNFLTLQCYDSSLKRLLYYASKRSTQRMRIGIY